MMQDEDWGKIIAETYCEHTVTLIHGWMRRHPEHLLMQGNASVQIFELTVLFKVSQTARQKLFLNCGEHLVDTATPEDRTLCLKESRPCPLKLKIGCYSV